MNETRTPAEINHLPVVGMVKLPPADGYLPDMHIVVCASPSIARETTYTVWTVGWQAFQTLTQEAQHWVASNGRYDLPTLDRALFVMCDRARDFLDRI